METITEICELQGRFLIGEFESIRPVIKRGTDTPVPGMFKIVLMVQGTTAQFPLDAVYWDNDQGEETKIARDVARLNPQKGDVVAVKNKSSAKVSNGKAYVNETAVALTAVKL